VFPEPEHRIAVPLPFLACAALLLLPSSGPCQIAIHSWTADNGLPQNVVSSICQTPDGYLWLATFDGLVRSDGVHFTTFNRSNTPGIYGNRFGSLFCTADGELWLGTEGSGVTHYRQGRFATYTSREGLLSDRVDGIAGDEEGKVWALAGGFINQWDAEKRRFVPLRAEVHRYSDPLSQDGRVGFARVANGALHLFVRGRHVQYRLPPGWPRGDPTTTVRAFGDRIWLTTDSGALAQLIDGQWSAISRRRAGGSSYGRSTGFTSEYRDSRGNVWNFDVVWEGSPIARYLRLPPGSQPTGIAFRSLFEDREGNIWLSTDGQGLIQVRKQTIDVYSKEQGLPDGNVYPIYEARDGAVWIGTWSGGLCRLKDGRATTYTTADGLASNRVYALFEDRDGGFWVSVEHGLHRMRSGRFESVGGHGIDSRKLYVRAIHQDRRGTLWFGTGDGLLRFEQGRWTLLTKREGLATDDVRVIFSGRSGSLWAGGYGGLSSIGDGRVQAWTEKDGLASNTVRALYEDSEGVLWIGTYDGGLGRLQNGRLTRITVNDGLFNNGVFQILEDARANLWMSCNRGIYRVSKRELNEFAAGKRQAVSSIPYGKRDGMKNSECNGGLSPAGMKSRDGRLWFPTQDGAAVIDPDKMMTNLKPPPVVIESCLIDGVPAAGDPVRVRPESENLEIQFTALSFVDSERIRFRYRLEGLDRDWVEAGTRRAAYYSHVPPGSYTFKVAAANSDGMWTEAGASLSLVMLPPIYRTWWFALLSAMTLFACLWLAWSYRLGQVERARAAQQAFSRQLIASQEAERQRIAAELHDSLGQRLVIIKNLALLSLSNGKPEHDLRQQMDEISAESSQAISEVREISYNLRPYQLDRLGLRNAILALIRNASRATSARVTADVDEIDVFLPKHSEINLYRIVQECLNNVIKHSEATEVDISIKRRKEVMSLLIRDNGRGFTPGAAAADPMRGGFGLVGIQERAELLGGRAFIQTAPGQGTTISIHIESGGLRNGR
jgi:signal transduction histidine kinase